MTTLRVRLDTVVLAWLASGALSALPFLPATEAFAPQPQPLTRQLSRSSTRQLQHLFLSGGDNFDNVASGVGGVLETFSSSVSSLFTIADGEVVADDAGVADRLAAAAGSMMDDASAAATAAAVRTMDSTPDAVGQATDAVDTANNNGWFGFLTVPIKGLLMVIHSVLVAVGLSADAWGVSIIALTVLIKILTFPLTKTQLESTNKMQAMQPAIKEIQFKYQSNPEVMNQKIAEFYQTNNINPLAGCLPSLVQIPVFIGLYRAVLDLAKENRLNEAFLWLPNLEGPTYGADPAHGSDWIMQGWVDGTPSLGWADTTSFLILPVLLVVSQFVSMELMQPKNQDPAQQQSNFILKLLPVMIGWFSLNVPAALCLYWMTNNIITTATTLFIRSSMKVEPAVMPGTGGSTGTTAAPPTIFAPPREKPSGFGGGPVAPPTMAPPVEGITPITPITTPMDDEIVDDDDEDAVVESSGSAPQGMSSSATDSSPTKKKRGGKKKKRQN